MLRDGNIDLEYRRLEITDMFPRTDRVMTYFLSSRPTSALRTYRTHKHYDAPSVGPVHFVPKKRM